ncbi:hypothetical protein [uncultured Endozoicomonas sp.]|uniref:hypothetical protein n=1 Tax=uncultured Endozoicomonas sp. TaxID=432652 RepID=UPI0026199768|nr:hypothetical protein [uncultured Endozoicomonas sp.]
MEPIIQPSTLGFQGDSSGVVARTDGEVASVGSRTCAVKSPEGETNLTCGEESNALSPKPMTDISIAPANGDFDQASKEYVKQLIDVIDQEEVTSDVPRYYPDLKEGWKYYENLSNRATMDEIYIFDNHEMPRIKCKLIDRHNPCSDGEELNYEASVKIKDELKSLELEERKNVPHPMREKSAPECIIS